MIRLMALAALVLGVALAGAASAARPEGDWLGSIALAGGAHKLALHIHRVGDGLFEGTIDSPDEAVHGRPIDAIEASGDHLTFVIPLRAGRYRGVWDAAKGAYVGTYVEGPASLPLEFAPGVLPPAPTLAGLDGEWRGQLGPLHVVLRVATDAGGTFAALDSPDQGAVGLPVSELSAAGDKVVFAVKSVGGRFEGVRAADGKSVAGTWTQGAFNNPLVFALADPAPKAAAPPPRRPPVHAGSGLASDAEVLQILKNRIDVDHQGVGIVVGLIDAQGRRTIGWGHPDQGDARVVDGDSIYEIGSISKVFTSLLLADMVRRGEVALDDPVAKYLPPGTVVPDWQGRQITLIDLATHTSGLPRMPANFAPKDAANPFADYDAARLYAFLAGYHLTRPIGEKYEYSNLGGGLLGHALARRAGLSYEALLQQRISGPLGMADTAIVFTSSMKAHLALGHDMRLKATANWDLGVLEGAGALRSSANDLLKLLAAELGYAPTPLKPSIGAQLAPRRPTGTPGLQISLGWHISSSARGDIVWHNGGTGGYRTFIGFNAATGEGVVVLSNVSTAAGADDIGFHLLDPDRPLLAFPPAPAAP